MTDLSALKDLFDLKKLTTQAAEDQDASALEVELASTETPSAPQTIKPLHKVPNPEHYCAALGALKLSEAQTLEIDRTGACEALDLKSALIILSSRQLSAGLLCAERAWLDPLMKAIAQKATGLLHSYALHEALFSKVQVEDADLGYRLSVRLETAERSLFRVDAIDRALRHAQKDPATFMLDEKKLLAVTREAAALRTRLGALSRYPVGGPKVISVFASEAMRYAGNDRYLWVSAPNFRASIALDRPVEPGALDLEDRERSLRRLIEGGVFSVSAKRAKELSARFAPHRIAEHLQEISARIAHLTPDEHAAFILDQPNHLWDFSVAPKNDSPLLWQVLGRLSWSPVSRLYHTPLRFIARHKEADEAERANWARVAQNIARPLYGPSVRVERWLKGQ